MSLPSMEGESLLKQLLRNGKTLNEDQLSEAYLLIRELYDEMQMSSGEIQVPPIITGTDLLPEVMKLRELRDRGELEGLSTGYHRIDKRSGGWRENELIIVAAASRVGKTKFVQNVFHNMAMKGIPSLFLNLEMGDVRAYDRLVTMHTSDMVGGSAADVGWLPLYAMPRDWNKPKLIEAFLTKYVQEKPHVRLFAIDHLTNLPRLHTDVRESHRLWCVFFRDIAARLKITVVLLHHFRKLSGEDQTPTMYDIADSQQVHDLADQVYLLHRHVSHPINFKYLHVRLDKTRNGGELGNDVLVQDVYHKLLEVDERKVNELLQVAQDVFKGVGV